MLIFHLNQLRIHGSCTRLEYISLITIEINLNTRRFIFFSHTKVKYTAGPNMCERHELQMHCWGHTVTGIWKTQGSKS